MTSSRPAMTRRALLGMAVALPLAGCANGETTVAVPNVDTDALAGLERKFDARLGVYAVATGTGATVAYRADERFAMCSTFKALAAAAVLQRNPLSHLDTVLTYTTADLLKSAVITGQHVATGLSIRRLCDAAVRYSDGTAGNLLLRDLGGPARLTAYVRGIGDTVTRLDRIEPFITEATPGDPRDTTSPRAFGGTFRNIVLGDALSTDKRDFLRDLLQRNATSAGAERIRAGIPKGWTVADKTGTGDYGTLNDIAIAWPPDAAPLVISIMSSKATRDADYKPALLAEAARHVVTELA